MYNVNLIKCFDVAHEMRVEYMNCVFLGWPTAVGLTDLLPRAFLSGPMLSKFQPDIISCS